MSCHPTIRPVDLTQQISNHRRTSSSKPIDAPEAYKDL
jgi:hypothetical protein